MIFCFLKTFFVTLLLIITIHHHICISIKQQLSLNKKGNDGSKILSQTSDRDKYNDMYLYIYQPGGLLARLTNLLSSDGLIILQKTNRRINIIINMAIPPRKKNNTD